MKQTAVKALAKALPLVLAMWAGVPQIGNAAPLSIGLAADVTSMDPHFWLYVPNQNIAEHVYDKLITRDDKLAMTPGLAVSWRAVDDLTWEIKLRNNVKFHDGFVYRGRWRTVLDSEYF